ncbi:MULTISPECIES: GNAT family N-acetyltransferase [Bacillaceae]|uniref:GNAT family N-acetyltransferase n=1 Tax=Evansella alkalicola TaxID=745819 RepID=A0ABS6JQR5_9BACI|nr:MULTISPECIES: GNAT family N-acetyltransferase [Bacillaceae]MBU9720790.1 GNAT family N-acetyltransferase [Bacillus alkalicola]
MKRICYLFGAIPSIEDAGEAFAKGAGGKEAHIALLILHRDGWEEYLPKYTDAWRKAGVKKWTVIKPDESGNLETEYVLDVLRVATGIFIGGGDTEMYHFYYTTDSIRHVIKERYNQGIPVAGCSAGAILMCEDSIISPMDSNDGHGKVMKGLGLLQNIAVSVHFSEWNDRQNIECTMIELGITKGYGIDEQACISLHNEQYYTSYGKKEGVHFLQVPQPTKGDGNISFTEITDKKEKQRTCDYILRLLPEWFGIEEAIKNYVSEVATLPMIRAEVNGEVVGFISILEHTKDADEIHLIAVKPDYHRSGIGRMLGVEFEQRAILNGKNYVSVKTLSDKHPDPHYRNTRLFYEGLGYVGVQVIHELWGKENPCLLMVKKL